MATVVMRLARNMDLHLDGEPYGLDTFQVEMRRRLWWHICLLDLWCSEDQGTDSEVLNIPFDTKIPLNINDGDIVQGSNLPVTDRTGITEMTFASIRYESIAAIRRMKQNLDSSPCTLNNNCQCKSKWAEAVQSLSQRVWSEYISHCSPIDPASRLYIGLAKTVPKISFVIHQPVFGPALVDLNTLDWIFLAAVEAVEFCRFIDSFPVTAKWNWYFRQSSSRWYLLTFLLTELCVRPPCPSVERAWIAVNSVYREWGLMGSKSEWQTVFKLMQRAQALRTGA
ncbi:hypothetical protein BDV59DRAFT_57007 [Aspergillus ambiguus]|uniref:fungal specific transcription factor domain-containing protein n=1 Tax=Aspergillus ambiguus TaxID=176160 RepID=UPI003CCD210D